MKFKYEDVIKKKLSEIMPFDPFSINTRIIFDFDKVEDLGDYTDYQGYITVFDNNTNQYTYISFEFLGNNEGICTFERCQVIDGGIIQ